MPSKNEFLTERIAVSGKKGRSGRKWLSVENHLVRGTFRPDRHGPWPEVVGTAALSAPAGAPEDLLAGLGGVGARFVGDLWRSYAGWNASKLLLLRRAGELADATAEGPSATDPRLWLARHRSLLATIAALGLED